MAPRRVTGACALSESAQHAWLTSPEHSPVATTPVRPTSAPKETFGAGRSEAVKANIAEAGAWSTRSVAFVFAAGSKFAGDADCHLTLQSQCYGVLPCGMDSAEEYDVKSST